MKNEPIRDPRILEALDAYFPGCQDMSDIAMESLRARMSESAELSDAYRRLQRLDQALADAFQDVPVPEGLEGRILARLQSANFLQRPEPASEATNERRGALEVGISRRRWLAAACTVAAAVALCAGLLGHLRRPAEYSRSDVLNLAIEHATSSPRQGGNPLSGGDGPPRSLPVSRALGAIVSPEGWQESNIRWRVVTDFLNRRSVAYDLVGPGGVTATLYVTACSVEGLSAEIPLRPMLSTGQSSVSAWQEGGLLYVLVVDGGAQAYEQFFAAAAGPVA